MNWKHLFWVVPLAVLVGGFFGLLLAASTLLEFADRYPIVGCLWMVDQAVPVDSLVRNFNETASADFNEYAQRRCVQEHILSLGLTDNSTWSLAGVKR